MSDGGIQDRAYPRAEQSSTAIRFVGGNCLVGGKGGGFCQEPIGKTFDFFDYNISKFAVYNRRIILRNSGFDPYSDAGPDGEGCDHSLGSKQPWYLGFGVDDTLTHDEIVAQNMPMDEAPFEIEIFAEKLPQPTDAGWNNKFVIYLAWGDSGFMVTSFPGLFFSIIKHDYDIKI